MTEQELKEKNPWKNMDIDSLYSEKDNKYFASEDNNIIDLFNKEANDSEKIILNVPPAPWQGNPLTAKVIFLSLNPCFHKGFNKDLAKVLQSSEGDLKNKMLKFRKDTLNLDAKSFMPEDNTGDPIGTKDAITMWGGWYWEKKLSDLRDDVCGGSENEEKIKQFYRDIAVIQYHGYSSEKYKKVFPLKDGYNHSQKFTREMIEFILLNRPNTLFVIMRAKGCWEELLSQEIITNKERFLIKENKSMSQSISQKNLMSNGEDLFEKISKLLGQ